LAARGAYVVEHPLTASLGTLESYVSVPQHLGDDFGIDISRQRQGTSWGSYRERSDLG
jgi:hypothetical protein